MHSFFRLLDNGGWAEVKAGKIGNIIVIIKIGDYFHAREWINSKLSLLNQFTIYQGFLTRWLLEHKETVINNNQNLKGLIYNKQTAWEWPQTSFIKDSCHKFFWSHFESQEKPLWFEPLTVNKKDLSCSTLIHNITIFSQKQCMKLNSRTMLV